jgi:quinol monooxygenase YgiN
MFARSSTMLARPASIDRGTAFLGDDLMPEMLAIDGCVGLSLLVNRETGRCVATSSWQDEEAMHASESSVPPLRKRLMEAFGAPDLTNEEWEVVVMHRDHLAPDGAHARVSYMRCDPAGSVRATGVFTALLPEIERMSGFCSASLLLNRESGLCVPNVIFDRPGAVTSSNERGDELRARMASQLGAEIIEVAEFELALAHLRVPELV